MEHNAVKSPLHYTAGRKYEPKDVIRDWGLNFNLGSALKYIARAGRKGNTVEDLEKAREYLGLLRLRLSRLKQAERELVKLLIADAVLSLYLRRKSLRVCVAA
mgnify:CR=1 FL=1